ncbi:hypothetical protein C6P45_002895 [Maudiozyma exigua]|uniref:Nucleolar protein SWM2 n=1 Tax=Maudiozyma exigua TaxID=34358 RepID=A0A9P7B317_MAUEX|nr:hypothetical protein C6P45_002895 [Kazachstania exigua]
MTKANNNNNIKKNRKCSESTYEHIGRFLTMKGQWKDSFTEFINTQENTNDELTTLLNESNEFISEHGSDSLTGRCKILQKILKSKMTAEQKQLHSNLLIESIDFKTDSLEMTNSERLEFDPNTSEQIVDPLSNLIIEELDVADYN